MSGAYVCGTIACQAAFDTELEMRTHCVGESHGEYEHPSKRYCFPCNLIYATSVLLGRHLQTDHCDHLCAVCSRYFQSPQKLRSHILTDHKTAGNLLEHSSEASIPSAAAGATHQASIPKTKKKQVLKDVDNRHIHCRVAGCDAMFKSPSGAAHHLESNTHHEINRHTVTAVAQTMDIAPSIALNKRNAEDASTITPLTGYQATAAAFRENCKRFNCFIPGCPRVLKSLDALNAHLNSAAHDDDEFKCPNKKCGRRFTLVSGFIQHIESQTCGLTNMAEIQGWFDGLAAQFDRLLALGGQRTGPLSIAFIEPGSD